MHILSSLGGSGLHHSLMVAWQLVQKEADGLDSGAEEVGMHAMLSASGAWDLCAEMRITVLNTRSKASSFLLQLIGTWL